MTTPETHAPDPPRPAAGVHRPKLRADVVDGADGTDEAPSDVRQYVTFLAGDEVFAVDMAPVQEIIRVPNVVRVPLAPATLDGLANLRGKVLPVISLRRMFGFADKPHDDATRALVIDIGQPLGFVVDKVTSVVGVDPSKLEGVGAIGGTMNAELLSGIMKDVGGHAVIMVLDFAKLVAQQFSEIAAVARHASAALTGHAAASIAEDDVVSDERQLVSFDVADQEYAVDIEDVREIVQVPEHIVRVPRSESHVVGMMTLRNRLLPLVSLRRMFGLPPQAADERSRIVVMSVGAAAVGVVVDSVNEVLRVPRADVDAMPGLLARDKALADIAEICRLDGGKRLVSIISASRLFGHTAVKDALTHMTTPHDDPARAADTEPLDDDEQVVVFRIGLEEFGVPIESVQEIVRVPPVLTQVPKAPAFVEGVINLRGAVLPVIDLRRRLGMPAAERSDRQRIMVFLIAGSRTGFIVDSVAEVLRIHKSAIGPAPRLSTEQGQLLARMANLDKQKRMVQLLAPAHLMEGHDPATLPRG